MHCTHAIEIRIQNAYNIFYLNNISYFKCSNTYLKYNFTPIKSIYFNLIYFNVAVTYFINKHSVLNVCRRCNFIKEIL